MYGSGTVAPFTSVIRPVCWMGDRPITDAAILTVAGVYCHCIIVIIVQPSKLRARGGISADREFMYGIMGRGNPFCGDVHGLRVSDRYCSGAVRSTAASSPPSLAQARGKRRSRICQNPAPDVWH